MSGFLRQFILAILAGEAVEARVDKRSMLTDKARVELGWAPRVDVAAALDRSAEWYKAFYAGSTPDVLRALTVGEIVSNMTTPPLSI